MLVVVLTVLGLGCASAAPPSYAEPLSFSGSTSTESVDRQPGTTIQLQAGSHHAAAAGPVDHPATKRLVATIDPAPKIPLVSASPLRARSTRADQPVRLLIDSVGIDVPVRPTGVAADGSMALPDTVRRAGWYRFSTLPGSAVGSTVIAGHVDSIREGLGPFAGLTDVRRDDRVVVTDHGGDRHFYRVTSRRHITRSRLPVTDLFDVGGPPRLVLITCGGAYDSRTGYHDNVVVLAEPDR